LLKTYKEFYFTLSTPLPLDIHEQIDSMLNNILTSEVLYNLYLPTRYIKEIKAFVINSVKIFHFILNNNLDFIHLDKNTVNAAFNLWFNITTRNKIKDIVLKEEFFPLVPSKFSYPMLINNVINTSLSYDAKTCLEKILAQKEESMRLLKIKYEIKRNTLKTLGSSILFLGRIIALEDNRTYINGNDIKIADNFLRFLFFRFTKEDITLLEKTTKLHELDILRKLNSIKFEDKTPQKLQDFLSKKFNFSASFEKITMDTIRILSRVVCVRENVKIVDSEIFNEGWRYFLLNVLGAILGLKRTDILLNDFTYTGQLLKKISKINIERDKSINFRFSELKRWFLEYVSSMEIEEKVPGYTKLINEIVNFIKFLSIVFAFRNKFTKCKLENIKSAIIFFFDIFLENINPPIAQ